MKVASTDILIQRIDSMTILSPVHRPDFRLEVVDLVFVIE